ncbi:MAG: hypothetical protein IPK16_18005 [Anaerolineales bacterium]|nr:hypothetical protein [Anaerolineales bacterium]
MPDLPTEVISHCDLEPAEFWQVVSKHRFAQVVARAGDHLLVRVHERFDFSRVVQGCQA